jgi:hypothetical protein
MPGLQTLFGELNKAFSRDMISDLVTNKEAFAPGKPLAAGVVVKSGRLQKPWLAYINNIPMSIQEALRGVIYHALTSDPPIQVTFAWAPGYDYELTIWDVPDNKKTRGGITVLIKSPYPGDRSK